MANPKRSSPSRRARWFVLLTLVLGTVAADQASKAYAASQWKGLPPQMFLGGMFQIRHAENAGAFLSLFANLPDEVRFWILTIGNAAMLAGLTAYLMLARRVSGPIFLALALLVGGGIGNLIDRARFQFVIDFFYIDLGFLHTGVFNVADMAITAAFLIMLPVAFWKEAAHGEDSPGSDDAQRPEVLEAAAEGPRP